MKQHLQELNAGERSTLFAAIEQQLAHEPLVETRNRKRLRPNPVAPWELRVGSLRVFYDVLVEAGLVRVLAIGKKDGSILTIGGSEVHL